MPPDDMFNMIVQAPWEEDIVWSSDEYKPSKKCIIAQSSAGWVPSGNIRTLQGYLANAYRKGIYCATFRYSFKVLVAILNSAGNCVC